MASSLTAVTPSIKAQTTFVTITSTLPADVLASSPSPQAHPAKLPVTHDILLAAPSPSSSSHATLSTLSTSIRHSSYPRPSPPGFLYPATIVPRAVQNQLQHAHAHTPMATSNVIWYLPYGLEVLIFTVIFIGLMWVGLVFLLTFPPRTWRAKKEVERRPVDKLSKYAGRDEHGRGDTSAREGVVELKHRRQPEHQRSKSSPATAIRFAIDSPPNPFLQPPQYLSPPRTLQPRTSSEWLRQHAAFFSATSSSSSHTEYDQEYDIEALEAGTAPRSPSLKAHKKSLSWADLDLGLDRMEGKVSGWVGKVVRWTDDDDEGVLLPVVNGRQGIKAE